MSAQAIVAGHIRSAMLDEPHEREIDHAAIRKAVAADAAKAALSDLIRCGYRILAPGELDAATIEACVGAVSQVKPIPALSGPPWEPQTSDFEAALRNLRGTNG